MPTHKTIKEYKRIRDTAPHSHWYFHRCSECNWFKLEHIDEKGYRKNYCGKWDRKVNPDQWARSCFVFRPVEGTIATEPLLWEMIIAEHEKIEPRPFTWKKGICKWHRREFYYKQYHPNDIRRYCSDYCRWSFKRFVRKIKKNSQLVSTNQQVEKKNCEHDVYSFSVSWGAQLAGGTKSNVTVKIPIWISYSVGWRFFARYCSICVVSYFLECVTFG